MDDEETHSGVIYQFPKSHQPSYDEADVKAAENCLRDGLPISYVKRIAVNPARYEITYPA